MADIPAKSEAAAVKKPPVQIDADKVKRDIAAGRALAEQGKVQEALDALLQVEKQCRIAEDMACGKEVCSAVVAVAHASGNWKLLLDHIVLLTKRRGQMKASIQAVVRQAAAFIDGAPSRDDRVELIKTLQAVTEGKIFVEIDRARLTKRLAQLYEGEGKVADAADALQEVAVETFGAMHRSEKIAFVLLQMRLCMDNGDFVRAQILSRKVSFRAFSTKGQEAGEISLQGTAIEAPEAGTPSMAELKILYYSQMIRFHKQSNNYLEICRCYLAIVDSEGVKEDRSKWAPILKKIVWYLVLSPSHSTDQGSGSDRLTLVATVSADARLADVPAHADLLTIFTTKEVTGAKALLERYAPEIQAEEDIFGGDDGAKRVADLKTRITQHNILVIGAYYTRVRMQRFATLLDLPVQEAEQSLSDLVVANALHAKIDRPAGMIRFLSAQGPLEVLDSWSDSISKLLSLVENACQKVQKESMQHQVPIGAS